MPTRTFLSENGVHACAASLPAFVSSKPWIFFAGACAAEILRPAAAANVPMTKFFLVSFMFGTPYFF